MTSHRIRVDHMPLGSLAICELRCMCSPQPCGSLAIFELYGASMHTTAPRNTLSQQYILSIFASLMYIIKFSLWRKYACIPGADFKSNIGCDLEFFHRPTLPTSRPYIQTNSFSTPLQFHLSGPAQACASAVVFQRPFTETVWVQSFAHALHLQG